MTDRADVGVWPARGARGLAPVGHCCAVAARFQAGDGRLTEQLQAHVTPKRARVGENP